MHLFKYIIFAKIVSYFFFEQFPYLQMLWDTPKNLKFFKGAVTTTRARRGSIRVPN